MAANWYVNAKDRTVLRGIAGNRCGVLAAFMAMFPSSMVRSRARYQSEYWQIPICPLVPAWDINPDQGKARIHYERER